MVLDFIFLCFGLYSLSLITYFLGSILNSFIRPPDSHKIVDITLHIFSGTTAIVVVSSIAYTLGGTVMFLILVPAFFLLHIRKLKFRRIKITLKLQTLGTIAISTLLALSSAFFIEYSEILNNDIIFYSKVAHWMPITGIENPYHYFNRTEPIFNGTAPYHYFELWLTAFISQFHTEIQTVFILKYIVYGFFTSFFFLGITAIAESVFRKIKRVRIFLAFIISFIPGSLFINWFNLVSPMNASIWGRPNYLIYFFILIPFTILFTRRNYKEGMLLLSLLPIVTITALPSVVPTYIVLCLLLAWRKLISKKSFFALLSNGFIVFVGILLFYKLTGTNISPLNSGPQEWLQTALIIWKAIAGQFFFTAIAFGIPAALLFVIYIKWKRMTDFNELLIVFFLLLFFGLGAFQVLTQLDNSYQFVYISYALYYLLICSTLLCVAIFHRWLRLLIVIIAIGFIMSMASKQDHYKYLFHSSSLINYHLKLEGLSQEEMNLLQSELRSTDVALFETDYEVMNQIRPKHRHFLTLPVPNYITYINSNLELYPIVEDTLIYGNPVDTIQFQKSYRFNNLLRFYRDSLTEQEYKEFVDADIKIKSIHSNKRDEPEIEISHY